MNFLLKMTILSITILIPAAYSQTHFCTGRVVLDEGPKQSSVEAVIAQDKFYYKGPLVESEKITSPFIGKIKRTFTSRGRIDVAFLNQNIKKGTLSSIKFQLNPPKTTVSYIYEGKNEAGDELIAEGILNCVVFTDVNFKKLSYLQHYRFTYSYNNTTPPADGEKSIREKIAEISGVAHKRPLPSAAMYTSYEFSASLEVAKKIATIEGVSVRDRQTSKDISE